MKKHILFLGTFLSSLVPAMTIVSCFPSNDNIRNDLREHEYLVNKKTQDSKNRINLDLSKIKRDNIENFSSYINGIYNSAMVSSGYGESRSFYSDYPNWKALHTGIDVFLEQGQEILAPNGAEIIGAYAIHEPGQWAAGIGGGVSLRIKISKLNVHSNLKEYVYVKKYTEDNDGNPRDVHYYRVPKLTFSNNGVYDPAIIPKLEAIKDWGNRKLEFVNKNQYENYLNKKTPQEKQKWEKDSEYVYAGLIHLAQPTMDLLSNNIKSFSYTDSKKKTQDIKLAMDIDINHPKKVKKGEVIGYVGDPTDNGGWAPHVDINCYSVLSRRIKDWTNYDIKKLVSKIDQKKQADTKKWTKNDYNSKFKFSVLYKIKTSAIRWKEITKKRPYPSDEQNLLKLLSSGNFDPNEIYNFYQDDDIKKVLYNIR